MLMVHMKCVCVQKKKLNFKTTVGMLSMNRLIAVQNVTDLKIYLQRLFTVNYLTYQNIMLE